VPAALAVGFLIFAVVVPDLGTAVVLGAVAAMVVFFVAGCNGATASSWRRWRCSGLVV
jgi:cell division protein FtsW (lipid II flippase)